MCCLAGCDAVFEALDACVEIIRHSVGGGAEVVDLRYGRHCQGFEELVAKVGAIVCHGSESEKLFGSLLARRHAGDEEHDGCQQLGFPTRFG